MVRDRIAAAGGDPRSVALVAVAKGFGVAEIAAACEAGVVDIGENYAQDLLAKASGPDGGWPAHRAPRWHFLGAVQRRKVRAIAPNVHLWQALDRLAAGHEVARHAPGAAVLVQVNITGLPARPGCPWADTPLLVDGLRQAGLDVRGLMGVGAREEPRAQFRRLAALRRDLGLREVSMGMSDDLEIAVEEGSTMVRVGRALFGPRPQASDLRRYCHPRGGG